MQNHHSPGMTSLGLCWENGKLNGNYYLGFRILGMGSIAVSAIKNQVPQKCSPWILGAFLGSPEDGESN